VAPESRNLQSLWDEIDTGRGGQDVKYNTAINDPPIGKEFQQNLQHLLECSPQVQSTQPRDTTKGMHLQVTERLVPLQPSFDLTAVYNESIQMFKIKHIELTEAVETRAVGKLTIDEWSRLVVQDCPKNRKKDCLTGM
jgi:hypothetical protein